MGRGLTAWLQRESGERLRSFAGYLVVFIVFTILFFTILQTTEHMLFRQQLEVFNRIHVKRVKLFSTALELQTDMIAGICHSRGINPADYANGDVRPGIVLWKEIVERRDGLVGFAFLPQNEPFVGFSRERGERQRIFENQLKEIMVQNREVMSVREHYQHYAGLISKDDIRYPVLLSSVWQHKQYVGTVAIVIDPTELVRSYGFSKDDQAIIIFYDDKGVLVGSNPMLSFMENEQSALGQRIIAGSIPGLEQELFETRINNRDSLVFRTKANLADSFLFVAGIVPAEEIDKGIRGALVRRSFLVIIWILAFLVTAFILHRNNVLSRRSRAEERYGLLFRSIGEGVVIIECLTNVEGEINNYIVLEANKSAADFIGRDAKWMTGKTGDVVYGLPQAPYLNEVNQVQKSQTPVSFDHYLTDRNRWFRFNLVPAGRLRQAAIITDITDIIRTSKELQQNEERLRQIFNSVSDAIMMHDDDGAVLEVNEQMLRMFAITREQALSLMFQVEISDRNNDFSLLPDYWNRAAEGETITFEWNARRPGDGFVFSVEIVLHPIKFQERNIILATIRDINTRKKLDKEKNRIEKMESVGMLAGGIAHDFNNILTGIIGNLNLAKMDVEPASELSEILIETSDACLKAKKLVDTFMEFAKNDEIARDIVDVNILLTELVDEFENQEQFKFQSFEKHYLVLGDHEQLRRAFRNILQNGLEAIQDGGNVLIGIMAVDNTLPAQLRVTDGQYVKISISDNGCGIDPEDLSKVFNPYYSTKSDVTRKGAGFGLPIAHNIIKRHGGLIQLDSKKDEGTVCSVYLPAANSDDD